MTSKIEELQKILSNPSSIKSSVKKEDDDSTIKSKQSLLPSEGDLKYKLALRVWGRDDARKESHSYLLDDMVTGISSPIGEVMINIRVLSLKELRPIIEWNRSNQMNKRNMIFQEALFIMDRLPNHFNRPREQLRLYRFGFLRKDKTAFRMVTEEEELRPIADLIGVVDYFDYDICLVPLSQLEPGKE